MTNICICQIFGVYLHCTNNINHVKIIQLQRNKLKSSGT